jgi:hypothetical protein
VSKCRIFNSPVSNCAIGFRGAACFCRLQAKFVTTDVEADIESLIEIRLDPKRLGVPGFAFFNIVNVIDCGA